MSLYSVMLAVIIPQLLAVKGTATWEIGNQFKERVICFE